MNNLKGKGTKDTSFPITNSSVVKEVVMETPAIIPMVKKRLWYLPLLVLLLIGLSSCAPSISGRVELFDAQLKPVTDERAEGTTINMINTTADFEKASHSVVTDSEGNFTSEKDALVKGTYKVEAKRLGYETETQTVELSGSSELVFKLKKILEGLRRSLEGADSDADKIINPGEVNIQPPSM